MQRYCTCRRPASWFCGRRCWPWSPVGSSAPGHTCGACHLNAQTVSNLPLLAADIRLQTCTTPHRSSRPEHRLRRCDCEFPHEECAAGHDAMHTLDLTKKDHRFRNQRHLGARAAGRCHEGHRVCRFIAVGAAASKAAADLHGQHPPRRAGGIVCAQYRGDCGGLRRARLRRTDPHRANRSCIAEPELEASGRRRDKNQRPHGTSTFIWQRSAPCA